MAIKKPIAKKPATAKDALKNLTVPVLRAKAKRAGIKLSRMDGSSKTKGQLVLALDKLPKKAPAKRKPAKAQTGTSSALYDKRRPALAPGKRISASGNKYTERRANRSDMNRKQMLGHTLKSYEDMEYSKQLAETIISDYLNYNPNADIFDSFNEVIDNYAIYYQDQMKVVSDLQYFDWKNNELGIEVTNIGQVAYLALSELWPDVERIIKKTWKKPK